MKTTQMKSIGLCVATILLLSAATRVSAETEKSGAPTTYKLTEAVIVRPLGFAATIAGSAIYLITWAASKATGNKSDMYNTLVRNPSKLAFGNRQVEKEIPQIVQKEVQTPVKTAKKH